MWVFGNERFENMHLRQPVQLNAEGYLERKLVSVLV